MICSPCFGDLWASILSFLYFVVTFTRVLLLSKEALTGLAFYMAFMCVLILLSRLMMSAPIFWRTCFQQRLHCPNTIFSMLVKLHIFGFSSFKMKYSAILWLMFYDSGVSFCLHPRFVLLRLLHKGGNNRPEPFIIPSRFLFCFMLYLVQKDWVWDRS